MNSEQNEQKTGYLKNVAANWWSLTSWILACLMAPWRLARPPVFLFSVTLMAGSATVPCSE